MAANVNNSILIPYDWFNGLSTVLNGEIDEELGAKRLWYLYKSAITGSQVLTGDSEIDYPVKSYLEQINKMKEVSKSKNDNISKNKEENELIKNMLKEEKPIGEIAIAIYGIDNRETRNKIIKRKGYREAKGLK